MKIKKGFTLAEVLITLAIIGVVSALVIPSVLKNYNDKKYNTARLKALKTFGEAGKLASINGEINGQPSARAFVENVLSKYLKITKVCDNDKAAECNFPEQIRPLNPSADKKNSNGLKSWSNIGASWTNINSPKSDNNLSAYIVTADGFIAKIFYNPNCTRKESNASFDDACINIIYDINGIKSPNHTGEDIGFVTVFFSGINTVAVAPGLVPYENNSFTTGSMPQAYASKVCANLGTNKNPYTLPSTREMSSLLVNSSISSCCPHGYVWAGSLYAKQPGTAYHFEVYSGKYGPFNAGANYGNIRAWCVRR